MTVVKLTISLEKELARQIRSSAREPISNWLADAARKKLRFEGMRRVLEDYEAEFGKITDEELAEADRVHDEARRVARQRSRAEPPVRGRRKVGRT